MKKFTFNYSIDGVLTMIPLRVTVEAISKEIAIELVHKKLLEEDYHIKKWSFLYTSFIKGQMPERLRGCSAKALFVSSNLTLSSN